MPSKRAVLYARLSITNDESVSIQRQLDACRKHCAAQGWEVVAEYVDDGVSASANAPEHRAGWRRVLETPRGTFDVVLVWKVDRLARKVLDFLHADEALQQQGAALAAVEDQIDMSTPVGRALATLLAVFGEMEAEAIRSRVKAARQALLKAGRVPGGAAPFGYLNAPNPDGPGKVLQKDPDTIAFVTEAAGRILRGDSFKSVAVYLDEVAPRTGRRNSAASWTITVTKRMLANPVLAGMTLYNPGNTTRERGKEVMRGPDGMPIIREDLAILDVETFRALEQRLATTDPKTASTESFLSGLVWCGDCGRKMYRNAKLRNGKRVRVFQCQGKDGCGQQVTGLECIVERRYLAEYGELSHFQNVRKPTDYDHTEINNQIASTAQAMQEDDADMSVLVARLQSLKALKSNQPDVQWVVQTTNRKNKDEWTDDPRATLLAQFSGVQLVKGKVGRKFDENRLSFIRKPVGPLPPGIAVESFGIPESEAGEMQTIVVPLNLP